MMNTCTWDDVNEKRVSDHRIPDHKSIDCRWMDCQVCDYHRRRFLGWVWIGLLSSGFAGLLLKSRRYWHK
jgi:hypothetical protein